LLRISHTTVYCIPNCCRPSPTIFFFDSSRALPYLHSFPTRRSSDLMALVHMHHPDAVLHLVTLLVDREADARIGAVRASASRSTDRKSTRLNSSHRTISYAVFCLKKKNKHHTIPHHHHTPPPNPTIL